MDVFCVYTVRTAGPDRAFAKIPPSSRDDAVGYGDVTAGAAVLKSLSDPVDQGENVQGK